MDNIGAWQLPESFMDSIFTIFHNKRKEVCFYTSEENVKCYKKLYEQKHYGHIKS